MRVYFGSTVLVPGEMDVFILFSPFLAYNNANSPTGRIRFKYMYSKNFNLLNSNWHIILRTENSTNFIESNSINNSIIINDNNPSLKNKSKISFDGENISKGAWLDKKLFKIGNT